MPNYATVPEFKTWVGLDDSVDDVVITNALAASSSAVDTFCNTHFWKTAVGTARFFDTCNPRWLRINDAAAVTEVATDKDADGVFETVWAASDFQLLPLNPAVALEVLPFTEIHAVGALTFPPASWSKRFGLVRVTGTWGWPAIPEPIRQGTMLVANRLFKRRNSPEGVAGFDEFGTIRISTRDDPDAVRLILPYSTRRRAGGWALA